MSKSILVVDDNAGVRTAIKNFFDKDSLWQVCGEAVDGMEAIAKANELQPDLVILDFCMPGMNGLETARLLRSSLPATPIILFTMFRDVIEQSEARAAGLTAVFSKSDITGLILYVENLSPAPASSRKTPQ